MKHHNKCVNGSLKTFPKGKKGCSAFIIVGVVMTLRSKTSNSHKRTQFLPPIWRSRVLSEQIVGVEMVDEWAGRSLRVFYVKGFLTGDRCWRDSRSTFRPWPSLPFLILTNVSSTFFNIVTSVTLPILKCDQCAHIWVTLVTFENSTLLLSNLSFADSINSNQNHILVNHCHSHL